MPTSIIEILLISMLAIILLLLFIIMYQKKINKMYLNKQGYARDVLFKKYFDGEDIKISLSSQFFFDAFIDIESQVEIDPEIRDIVIKDLEKTRFVKRQYRYLNALSKLKRKVAVFYIGSLKTELSVKLIKQRLRKEKNESVKFYIIETILPWANQSDIDFIMNDLYSASKNYSRWLYTLLKNHFSIIKPFLDSYLSNDHIAIQKLMIYLAKHVIDEDLKRYVVDFSQSDLCQKEIKLLALDALSVQYPNEIATKTYCMIDDIDIQKIAIQAASKIATLPMLKQLIDSVNGMELDVAKANAISRIIYEDKSLILFLIEHFQKENSSYKKEVIARALSHHIDYLIIKLKDEFSNTVKDIIHMILSLHMIEDLIDFINQNKDQEIDKLMQNMLKIHMSKDTYLLNEFSIYLRQDFLAKIGVMKKSQPVFEKEKAPFEKKKAIFIILWISLGIALFPILYFSLNFRLIFNGQVNALEFMIINFNYYLVIYFLSINAIYLILLFISLKGADSMMTLWKIKKRTLLFEHDLLPSISIIAPAYNEEKSIIESVTSLLNLKYPKYEVIVVNDGSKDQTVQVLINHFGLERKHPFFKLRLKTKPLRGVYVNKHIPNLIVIDKHNGGKADALNLGINAAKHDYVCGIDADSLLEQDALLKLMSITLDHSKDYIAIGGNIVPVNGCIVDKGKIEKSGLGKKSIVKYQTLEYLRAFSTGRIGWAKLNSLLIISGAFGLFHKQSLLETGGYLTISGDLKKDTVGEDMELVVRLTYEALSKKRPYLVDYVYFANCYTELPSDYGSLFKQRNRWQRGLLDILSYHRRLLFNPKYKTVAFIAFPYFFFYEMIGPFVEAIGYISIILGFILGILNIEIVILLFIATIGLGIIVSLTSLWIAERKDPFYSVKDTFILMLIAIIENFGYRQMMSLHRIISTFSSLREKGTWGTQKRQGFSKLSK